MPPVGLEWTGMPRGRSLIRPCRTPPMHDPNHPEFPSDLNSLSDAPSPRELERFLEHPRIAPHAVDDRLKVLVRSWRAREDDDAPERGSRPPKARPTVVSALLSAVAPVLKFFPSVASVASAASASASGGEKGLRASRGKALRDREAVEAQALRDEADRAAKARLRRAIPDWTWDEAHRPILAPAAPERILALNEGVLRRLSTAVGDEALFYAHVWPLVVRWAEVAQLLPRSPSGPFSEEGGLFRSGLETAVRSVEHFNAMLPRTDLEPKARRLYTVKMTVAACAAGLFYDAGVFESLRIEAIPEADAKMAGSPSADPFAFPTRRVVFEPMAETLYDFAKRHAGFVLELVWTKSVLEERARREAVLALKIRGDDSEGAEAAEEEKDAETGGEGAEGEEGTVRGIGGSSDADWAAFAARNRPSPRADAFYGTSFVLHLLPMLLPSATVRWLAHGTRLPGARDAGDSGLTGNASAWIDEAPVYAALQCVLLRSSAAVSAGPLARDVRILVEAVLRAHLDVMKRRDAAAVRISGRTQLHYAFADLIEKAVEGLVRDLAWRINPEEARIGAESNGKDDSESSDGENTDAWDDLDDVDRLVDRSKEPFVRALLWGSDGLYGKFPETAIDVINYLREHFGLTDLPDDINLVAAVMAEAGIVRTAAAGTVLHRVECPDGWDAEALGLPSGIRSWNALAFAHPEALVDLAVQSARGRVEVKPIEGPVTKILRDEERERAFAEGRDPSLGRPERPETAGRPRLVWVVRTGSETSPAVARLVADAVDVLNDRPDAERFATNLGLFIPESAFPDGDLSDIEPLLRLSGLFVMRTSTGRAVLPRGSSASNGSESARNSFNERKPRGPRVDREGLDVLWAADEIAGGTNPTQTAACEGGAKSSNSAKPAKPMKPLKPRTRPSAPSDRLGVVIPATRVRIVGRWKNGRESEMPWPAPGRWLAGEE